MPEDPFATAAPPQPSSPTQPDAQPPSNNSPALSTYPNIIIFGETGVGKSSLVNMLVSEGAPRANVSSQALGCTFASLPYLIKLSEQEYRIWDTAGLNEGTYSSPLKP